MTKNIKLYILRLKSGKYYIGISNDAERRFLQHLRGTGAKVCKYDPPEAQLHTIDLGTDFKLLAKAIENYTTMLWAKELGAENVMGGIYVEDEYRKATKEWVEEELIRTKSQINISAVMTAFKLDIENLPRPTRSGTLKLNETIFIENN